MLRVIDFMSIGSAGMTYVIKDINSGTVYWAGTIQDFVRHIGDFFLYYMSPVKIIDTDCTRGNRLLILYIE